MESLTVSEVDIDKASRGPKQPNEGEGKRAAARAYNERVTRFAKSGNVENKAHDARQVVDGNDGKVLDRAEAAGESHSAGDGRATKSST